MTFARSMNTTWGIFGLTEKNAALSRTLLICVPLVFGLAAYLMLAPEVPIVIAIFLAVVVSLGVARLMAVSSPEEQELVERHNNSQYAPEYVPDPELQKRISEDVRHYHYYQGVGEWFTRGHVPAQDFVDIVRLQDEHVRSIPLTELLKLVKHTYAINTFAPRNNHKAIKLVSGDEKHAYPITRLHVPYDNYIPLDGEYPYPAPVVPLPYAVANDQD